MKSKTIDIYFFSGTGNTYLAAKAIEKCFHNQDYKAKLFCLDRSDPKTVNLNHTIGLGMTTAYFSTYHFVWKFIENLPQTNGTDIFMFDTMGGFSGSLVMSVKKVLLKKGYNPIGACEFVMPSNLTKKEVSNEELSKKFITMEIKAELFVNQLITDKAKWSYNPIFTFIFSLLYKLADPPKQFRKKYPIKIDTGKCIQCNICYNSCPSDNIRMYEFPRFEDNCELCMRCFSYCPVNAISFQNNNYIPYRSAEIKEIMVQEDNQD